MRVKAGPAKREGNERIIYDAPLGPESLRVGDDDRVTLTFCATGIDSEKSSYRYTMTLGRDELLRLAETIGCGERDPNGDAAAASAA